MPGGDLDLSPRGNGSLPAVFALSETGSIPEEVTKYCSEWIASGPGWLLPSSRRWWLPAIPAVSTRCASVRCAQPDVVLYRRQGIAGGD